MKNEVLHILIAEDDIAHAAAVQRNLQSYFPDALIKCVTGAGAFREQIALDTPQIALLDMYLADGNGIELLSSFSGDTPFPVIMMTSFGNEQVAVDSIKAGALAYIVKSPDAFESIGKTVENTLWEWKLLQEKKQGQGVLYESERFLRATLDALSAHISILDDSGVIVSVNRSWMEFAEANSATGNVSVGSSYLAVCDAATGPCSEGAAEMAGAIRALARGDMDAFSLEYACHSPGEERWFIAKATRFAGIRNNLVVVAHENITKRKLAERERETRESMLAQALGDLKDAQARVIQQEKMASVGQLAAGVAHEINNPMGYITSNMNVLWKYSEKLVQFIEALEQALEQCADQATKESLDGLKHQIKLEYVMKDLWNLISESLEGSKRVSKIVNDLKSFSRAGGDEALPSDLNECIMSTINVVRNEIKYVAELDLRLGELPLVVCRSQQISQVVMNLLVNAAHAISDKGVITLATLYREPDNLVEISVSDTGCGIAPENLGKIFEPFFTTKEPGKGTGLGLAISYDIVRKHGGELLVSSAVGKGTTFTMRLPAGRVEI